MTLIQTKRASEKGSALVYILIAIALLAALTFSFMDSSSQQTTSQNAFRAVASLQGQIDTIRSSLQECVLKYHRGDGCIDGSKDADDCDPDPADAPDANKRYPLAPDSDYFDNATPGIQDNIVGNLRCPGNNPGTDTDHDNHAAMFGGSSGKFMPPPPDLFNDWQYYNGQDGVYFWTSTSKGDAFLESALEKLDENYSECEADVIDARSGAVALDDATPTAETTCASGELCFRVWVITNSPAGQHQDGALPDDCDGDGS